MVAETATTALPEFPARFRGAPRRNAAIARPLALLGRVRRRDEGLVDEIGRRLLRRDEVGAELAAAMRCDASPRVTAAVLHRAIAEGARDDDPPALRRFVAALEREPAWLDRDLLERGARAYRRMGRSRDDVLLALSLIGGYRYAGPADLLVATGGLTGTTAMRRLGETTAWGHAVARPGGLARDGGGFRTTAHVRAMHALVNDRFERHPDWDSAVLGLPVNRSDLAGTLALFSATAILGVRVLGRRVPRADARAVMHLWRYVGFLMGVDEDWLFADERAQHAFDHHLLLAQGGPTPAGAALTTALVEGTRRSHAERGHPVPGLVGPASAALAPAPLPRRGGVPRPGAARGGAVDGAARARPQRRRVLAGRGDRAGPAVAGTAQRRGRRGRPRAPARRAAPPSGRSPGLRATPDAPAEQDPQRPVKRGSRRSPNAVNASARSALGRNAAFQAPT